MKKHESNKQIEVQAGNQAQCQLLIQSRRKLGRTASLVVALLMLPLGHHAFGMNKDEALQLLNEKESSIVENDGLFSDYYEYLFAGDSLIQGKDDVVFKRYQGADKFELRSQFYKRLLVQAEVELNHDKYESSSTLRRLPTKLSEYIAEDTGMACANLINKGLKSNDYRVANTFLSAVHAALTLNPELTEQVMSIIGDQYVATLKKMNNLQTFKSLSKEDLKFFYVENKWSQDYLQNKKAESEAVNEAKKPKGFLSKMWSKMPSAAAPGAGCESPGFEGELGKVEQESVKMVEFLLKGDLAEKIKLKEQTMSDKEEILNKARFKKDEEKREEIEFQKIRNQEIRTNGGKRRELMEHLSLKDGAAGGRVSFKDINKAAKLFVVRSHSDKVVHSSDDSAAERQRKAQLLEKCAIVNGLWRDFQRIYAGQDQVPG